MSVLLKLWRGELPLPITFWLFGMVIGTVVSVLVTNFALEPTALTSVSTKSALLLMAIIYTGVMCVALWRSADKYKGAPVWSICARFYSAILFMSFVSFIINLFKA